MQDSGCRVQHSGFSVQVLVAVLGFEGRGLRVEVSGRNQRWVSERFRLRSSRLELRVSGMRSGSEKGSNLRLTDLCLTQLYAQK